ncbi:carboxypeptidase-like regulatory domain-containing protein, partial [candidate division KSB1 bacterium]|nr:carboxypeptidase-like regulatory domain-containing protein [candidate division KSB1 bacterium]
MQRFFPALKNSWALFDRTRIAALCLLLVSAIPQSVFAQLETGSIAGRVVVQSTSSPLPAVNIIIKGTQLGAASDAEGRFEIPRVPAGIYNLEFRMIGYETRLINKVVVNPRRTTIRQVELIPTVLETEGVVVT